MDLRFLNGVRSILIMKTLICLNINNKLTDDS